MSHPLRRARAALIAAVATVAAGPAMGHGYQGERGYDVDLRVTGEHYQTDLDYGDRTVEHRTSRLGFQLFEVGNPQIQPGLFGGWLRSRVDDPGDPVADATRLSGYYIGAGVRSHLFHREPVSLLGEVRYTWHDVDGSRGDTEIEREWTELQARLGPMVRVGPVRWTVGGYVSVIDGDQYVDGRREGFEHDRLSGAYTQLDVMVDRTGYVGLHADTGGNAGVHMVFGRIF
ncbi:hypothetical protein [Halorhodospira halophila]|uniref:Cellulose biosynthesis protein BcsS n=1 Tax=Halorhodospira halophila (strain DSM 244 / SL1) TaxID=349124 RepID=A1WYQ6_HALHL|nr:hypothetical protein [Halorhodospira halophila]ABM62818.1 hypothetical protein Hhal_2054 [Halorhodospira halophila SL1]MBK1728059.1 hypothetical protein [Halorhodospira halophila]